MATLVFLGARSCLCLPLSASMLAHPARDAQRTHHVIAPIEADRREDGDRIGWLTRPGHNHAVEGATGHGDKTVSSRVPHRNPDEVPVNGDDQAATAPDCDISEPEGLATTRGDDLRARLAWMDGGLASVEIFGAPCGPGEDVAINTRAVFRVEGSGNKLTLTRDPSVVVAREKRSASGVPTRIELDPKDPTPSASSEDDDRTMVRLKWQGRYLAGVRVEGPFLRDPEHYTATRTRYVFKADTGGDQSVLAPDPSACPAWVEFSEAGAPVRIELQHRADAVGEAPSRDNTVVSFTWENGTLVGVRVRGAFPGAAASDAAAADVPAPDVPDRRVFRIRHQDNEVYILAEAPAPQEKDAPQIADLNNVLQALVKNVRNVEKRLDVLTAGDATARSVARKGDVLKLTHETARKVEGDTDTALAIDKVIRGVDKKVDALGTTLREDLLDVANGVVGAMWRTQGELERVDAALPLVLIAQIHRSGGTLLSRLFDGHPEVLAMPQELIWDHDLKSPKYRWPDLDPAAEGPLRIARRLVGPSLYHARIYNLLGYAKTPSSEHDQRLPFQWSQWAYVETFLDAWQAKPPRTRRECFDLFMTAYFTAFLDWQGSRLPKKFITAFKTNMNFVRSYPENEAFFDDYPDGVMVSICRHPSDWFASATREGKKYSETADAIAVWRESAESSLLLKERHPNQMVLVSFETLIADPAKVMRRLVDRIGLTWDPVLTVPTFNGMPVASNSSFEAAVGIDESVLGRRDALPRQVREQIESECLPVYQRFADVADS
jgi:hypothetical protein